MQNKSLYFLSLFDPRLRPKGSRDPLGSEAVWGHLGRRLVGNLTTVTSNLESFFVALLSCNYAHQAGRAELSEFQERFARMEQLLAYLRLSFPNHGSKQAILGITKAKARLSNNSIFLGLAYPLLTNQLSMGLWGYYTPAMARADLVDIENRQLTEQGQKIADELTVQLGKAWPALCQICDQGVYETKQALELAVQIESVLYAPVTRTQFVEALIASNNECQAQAALYKHTKYYLTNVLPTGSDLKAKPFLDYLAQCGESQLENCAKDIQRVEPVLVVNNRVFTWLQGQHDNSIDDVFVSLNQRMNTTEMFIPALSQPHQSFLQQSAELLNKHNSVAYLDNLLQHHKAIMKKRNGAPWVEVRDGKVFVRVVSDAGKLPAEEQGFNSIQNKLENSYFLYSFLAIAQEGISKEAAV